MLTSWSLIKRTSNLFYLFFFKFYYLLIYITSICFKPHSISPHILLVGMKIRMIKSDDFLIIMFCNVDFVLYCTFILCGMISIQLNLFGDLWTYRKSTSRGIFFSRNEQQSFNSSLNSQVHDHGKW